MFLLDDGSLVHSASDLAHAAACEFSVVRTLDRRLGRSPGTSEPDRLVQRVLAVGDAHERRILDAHVARFGRWNGGSAGVRTLERPGRDAYDTATALAAMSAATVDALRDGADVLYQAGFFDGRFAGWADFLERDPATGAWGVCDAKLARTERVTALLQLAAYAHHLSRTGFTVQRFVHLELGSGRRVSHRVDDVVPVYLARTERLVRVLEQHREHPGSVPVRLCGRCADCQEHLEISRDPLLVSGMTTARRDRLRAAGIETLDTLATSTGSVPGVDPAALDRLRAQASLQVAQETAGQVLADVFAPEAIGSLPDPSPGDLFFDFEGDPLWYDETPGVADDQRWGLEYLFGLVEAPVGDATPVFRPLWAHDRASERTALADFLALVRERRTRFPDMHVYHYAPYERTALLRLAGRHGVGENEIDQLLRDGVLVDLYATVRASLRTGQRSLSLKAVEPLYLAEVRGGDVTTAGESITEYADACTFRERGDLGSWQNTLDQIAEYNRLDCLSTLGLRDWLLEQAAAAGVPVGNPVVSDVAESGAGIEEDELVRGLREFADTDGVRSADQQAVAMLAAAVNYHQREEKPFWWAHFERLSSDPEGWTDERSTFVVQRAEVVSPWAAPTGRQKKQRRTVRLLGKLAAGSDVHRGSEAFSLYEPHLPDVTKTGAGALRGWLSAEVVGVEQADDPELVVLEVTELAPPTAGDLPDLPMALAPTSGPRTTTLAASIRAFAAAVSTGLPSLPKNPALDILRRRPPSLRTLRTLVRPADAADFPTAITASVRDLDDSYLAVQGPPGTGKSFTGARVVAALVAEGWKVGVVAQSHTTVENLLQGILGAGVAAAAVGKKLNPGSGAPPWQVLGQASTVGKFFAERTGGCVVGGTIWDFADPAKLPDGGFDLIVVDEAGQFSLANTVVLGRATRRLLLLGDPQQLPQVSQGTHPEPVDRSALGWLTDGHETLPDGLGYFLDTTWRMHPAVCEVVSRLAYDDKLFSNAPPRNLDGVPPGVHSEPVEHAGNATVSSEEAERVRDLVVGLLGRVWAGSGRSRPLDQGDVLVVAAYNAQVGMISRVLAAAGFGDVQVGTVDGFQGREAAVVIVSLAASSPSEAPRGMEFLVKRNRLNVAISRAQWASFVVHSSALGEYLPASAGGLGELGAFLRITSGPRVRL